MNEYEIEKDIELPTTNAKGKSKYPWSKLKIGESFFIPDADLRAYGQRGLSSCAVHQNKRTGSTFTVRMVESGLRIWRID